MGALLGLVLRAALPEHHLSADSKDVVRLASGVMATISALVPGLLIASANSSFLTQGGEIQAMGVRVIPLDGVLALHGPETDHARDLLRRTLGAAVERIWHGDDPPTAPRRPFRPGTSTPRSRR